MYLLGCFILAPLAAATPICFALALLWLPIEARDTKHSAELQTALILSGPAMCLLCFVLSNKTQHSNRVWKLFKASTVLSGLLFAMLITDWFDSTLQGVLLVVCLSSAIIAAACLLQYMKLTANDTVLIFTCIALTVLFPVPLHAVSDPSFILIYFTMSLPSFVAAGAACAGLLSGHVFVVSGALMHMNSLDAKQFAQFEKPLTLRLYHRFQQLGGPAASLTGVAIPTLGVTDSCCGFSQKYSN